MKKNICHYYADIYQTNKDDKNKVKVASKEFIEKIKIKVKYELKKYFENININFNHKDLIKF